MGLYNIVLNYREPSVTIDGLHRSSLIDGWTYEQLAEIAAKDDPPSSWLDGNDFVVNSHHEEAQMVATWTVSRPFWESKAPTGAWPAKCRMSEADVAQVALHAHERGCQIGRAGLRLLVAVLRPDLEIPKGDQYLKRPLPSAPVPVSLDSFCAEVARLLRQQGVGTLQDAGDR